MKAVVAAFNQEKALVGAFSVITNLRMELFEALAFTTSAGVPMMAPTRPAHAELSVCVSVLSSRLELSRIPRLTLSYVLRSPRLTRAARHTLGQQPRQSPVRPAWCSTLL